MHIKPILRSLFFLVFFLTIMTDRHLARKLLPHPLVTTSRTRDNLKTAMFPILEPAISNLDCMMP
jgi:hypothetical protein